MMKRLRLYIGKLIQIIARMVLVSFDLSLRTEETLDLPLSPKAVTWPPPGVNIISLEVLAPESSM